MKQFNKGEKFIAIGFICLLAGLSLVLYGMHLETKTKVEIEQMRLDAEKQAVIDAQLREDQLIEDAMFDKLDREWDYAECVEEANDAYWSYMELNGDGKRYDEEGVTALTRYWTTAQAKKDRAEEVCLKRFY